MNNTGKYFGIVHDSSATHSMEARIMKNNTPIIFRSVITSVSICLFAVVNSYGGDYKALNGLNDRKVVFDVRAKTPESTGTYPDLIHKTFSDKNIRKITGKTEIAVVSTGAAVQLLSGNTDGFYEEEFPVELPPLYRPRPRIASNWNLYVCSKPDEVDPATILPGIRQVEDG